MLLTKFSEAEGFREASYSLEDAEGPPANPMMSHLPNPPNLTLPTWDDSAPASLLGDVENRNPSAGGFQNIPLQTLTGHSALPSGSEGDQLDTNAPQSGQEQSELTNEDRGLPAPAPPEIENGNGETLVRPPSSSLEKWQLPLSAGQVIFGLLGCAGSWATIKLTIYGWKLSQWTAWMTFRDECRALLVGLRLYYGKKKLTERL